MADEEKIPQSGTKPLEARALLMTASLRRSSRSISPDAARKQGGGGSPLSPDLIFFGYSHKSERWLEQVLLPFKPAEELRLIEVFSDQDLENGDEWHHRIQANISRAKVAILLIDSHFLTSRYCLEHELRPLLERQKHGEVQIIPILVEPCHWKLFPGLRRLQLRTFANRLSLSELPRNQVQAQLSAFAWEVLESLGVTPPEHPDPDQPSPGSPSSVGILFDQSGSMTGILDGRRRFGRARDPKDLAAFFFGLRTGLRFDPVLWRLPWDLAFRQRSWRYDGHLPSWCVDIGGATPTDAFALRDRPERIETLPNREILSEPNERFSVLIVGSFRSGKSTLLNALLSDRAEQAPIFFDKPLALLASAADRVFKLDFTALAEPRKEADQDVKPLFYDLSGYTDNQFCETPALARASRFCSTRTAAGYDGDAVIFGQSYVEGRPDADFKPRDLGAAGRAISNIRALARSLARKIGREREEHCGGQETGLSDTDDVLATDGLDRSIELALSCAASVQEERDAAPSLLAELLALPAPDRETAVVVNTRYQSYTLASYILERCEKSVFHDSALARELARLARSIAGQVDPRSCGGTAALADLEAYALAVEGNALRVAGEIREALLALMQARQIQEEKGSGADLDLAWRIDLMEASLRRDIRQFDASRALFNRAAESFAMRDRDQMGPRKADGKEATEIYASVQIFYLHFAGHNFADWHLQPGKAVGDEADPGPLQFAERLPRNHSGDDEIGLQNLRMLVQLDTLSDFAFDGFVGLEMLPLDPNGKGGRRTLSAPEWTRESAGYAPATPPEEILAGIWAEVLRRDLDGTQRALEHVTEVARKVASLTPSSAGLDFRWVLRDLIVAGCTIFCDNPEIDYDFKREVLKTIKVDNVDDVQEDFWEISWPPSYELVDLANTCRSTGELLPF